MADTTTTSMPEPIPSRWTVVDIFWLVVLVISILVGFGMTIFAPI
ncbi:MAG TPA: hypothetical protein VL282_07225 [Tepidisphaeraceae bacterium]|jgi:hypothetical protein|nr:hypothetical protein [Tepidisphaeraceae bacterium]